MAAVRFFSRFIGGRIGRFFLPSAEDARDAVQSGLEILLRHRHRIGAEWVLPWLHTVVRHEALRPRREGSRGLALEAHNPEGSA